MRFIVKLMKPLAPNEQEDSKLLEEQTYLLVPAPEDMKMTADPLPHEHLGCFSSRKNSFLKTTPYMCTCVCECVCGGELAYFDKCDIISLGCFWAYLPEGEKEQYDLHAALNPGSSVEYWAIFSLDSPKPTLTESNLLGQCISS